MIRFHGGERSVWDAISQRTGPRTPILAAIAYLTDADALKLKAGDVLICNLSKRALATGSSNPHIVHQLAVDGIEIRSHAYLHAKVVLAGRYLFVGSMNASDNAANNLDEAAIETTDRSAHGEAWAWLQDLRTKLKPLSPDQIETLFPFYQKPKGGGGPRKGKKASETSKGGRTPRTWYIATFEDLHRDSAKADEILEEGPDDQQLAGYEFESSSFPLGYKRDIRKGDRLIINHDDGAGTAVWPSSIVWHVETFDKRRWFFTAYPKSDAKKTMTWKAFKKLAEASGIRKFTSQNYSRLVPPDVATRIEDSWPKPTRRRR